LSVCLSLIEIVCLPTCHGCSSFVSLMTRHLGISLSEKLSLRKPRSVFVSRSANCRFYPAVTFLHITLTNKNQKFPTSLQNKRSSSSLAEVSFMRKKKVLIQHPILLRSFYTTLYIFYKQKQLMTGRKEFFILRVLQKQKQK